LNLSEVNGRYYTMKNFMIYDTAFLVLSGIRIKEVIMDWTIN